MESRDRRDPLVAPVHQAVVAKHQSPGDSAECQRIGIVMLGAPGEYRPRILYADLGSAQDTVADSSTVWRSILGSGPDASIHRQLESTLGAWTDAPGDRASGQDLSGMHFLDVSIRPPEFGYAEWKWSKQATLWTARKDSKIKGFQLTR